MALKTLFSTTSQPLQHQHVLKYEFMDGRSIPAESMAQNTLTIATRKCTWIYVPQVLPYDFSLKRQALHRFAGEQP